VIVISIQRGQLLLNLDNTNNAVVGDSPVSDSEQSIHLQLKLDEIGDAADSKVPSKSLRRVNNESCKLRRLTETREEVVFVKRWTRCMGL